MARFAARSRAMLEAAATHIIARTLSFRGCRRLASALLDDISARALRDELAELEERFASVDTIQLALEDRIRRLKVSGRNVSSARTRPLRSAVMEAAPPWHGAVRHFPVPSMISDEEAQYYEYIGAFFEGRGAVVELGPWLGSSTHHIIRGLDGSSQFEGRTLHVVDDFIWRSDWMDRWTPEGERLPHHADFRPLFDRYTGDIAHRLDVTCARISDYDGNAGVPPLVWRGGPVEMMFIDCGRTVKANQAWFEIFARSFIPDVTLLMMQDWRLHRERPRLHYNQTAQFTAAHPEMELVHEVRDGGLATFLFRGR